MLTYPETSVGRDMSSDFFTFQKEASAGDGRVGKDEKTVSPVGFALKKTPVADHKPGNCLSSRIGGCYVRGYYRKADHPGSVSSRDSQPQGGNAGAQSLAVVMCGLVTPAIAWGWCGNPWLGVVIGLGMVINLIIAGFAGRSIPIIMKRLGIDPAQSSSIILTTVTDVMGFPAFLGLAVIFQNFLI